MSDASISDKRILEIRISDRIEICEGCFFILEVCGRSFLPEEYIENISRFEI